jgi:hypothetical protein
MAAQATARHMMQTSLRRSMRAFLRTLSVLAILLTSLWATPALLYSPLLSQTPGRIAAGLYVLLTVTAIAYCWSIRHRGIVLTAYATAFLTVLLSFHALQPSNQRNWQTDVAILPTAIIADDKVLVRNIRNFSYRSEFDYTPTYYDRTFDLKKLEGIDLISVYWMGPQIAHIFLSFAFSDGQHLAVSIEARKEKGEAYSVITGFFRQQELYYVVADERDVIGLRTNYRKNPPEDVYIYRLKGPIENARRLFIEYMRQINELAAQPAFYNTLSHNCTTTIWLNSRVNQETLPFHWELIATGYLPDLLYRQGRLEDRGLSFEALRAQAHANPRAQAADITPDFSARIRTSVPTSAKEPAP